MPPSQRSPEHLETAWSEPNLHGPCAGGSRLLAASSGCSCSGNSRMLTTGILRTPSHTGVCAHMYTHTHPSSSSTTTLSINTASSELPRQLNCHVAAPHSEATDPGSHRAT